MNWENPITQTKTVCVELTVEEIAEVLDTLSEQRERLKRAGLEHRAELCFQALTKLGVSWTS